MGVWLQKAFLRKWNLSWQLSDEPEPVQDELGKHTLNIGTKKIGTPNQLGNSEEKERARPARMQISGKNVPA